MSYISTKAFPFCTKFQDNEDDRHPFFMSYEDIIKLYWRVKKFSFDFNCSIAKSESNFLTEVDCDLYGIDLESSSDPDEVDLSCDRYFTSSASGYGGNYSVYDTTNPNNPVLVDSGTLYYRVAFRVFNTSARDEKILYSELFEQYMPYVEIEGGLFWDEVSPEALIQATNLAGINGPCSIWCNGYAATCKDGAGWADTYSTVALQILNKEYFEYDPGDIASYPGKDGSGPVWDKDTGAQLRNPFNIVKKSDGTFFNPNF